MSKHGLSASNAKTLRQIIQYIIGVYMPCWFYNKKYHFWSEGPNHVLFLLKAFREQSQDTIEKLTPYIRSSAFNLI